MSDSAGIALGSHVFKSSSRDLLDARGNRIDLRNKSSEVLACLVERAGEIVTKSELMERAWPDTVVTDESLSQCISEIRRAIGDADQKVVKTHVGKGYSLAVAEVSTPLASRSGRRLLVGLVAVLLVAALAWLNLPNPEPAEKPRIAVLAFEDLSVGDDQGYLNDGIAEGIITELAGFNELGVIARNSSFSFRGSHTDIQKIAAELRADFVVEGSMQKSGELLRVTVQLIDGRDGTHIWAHEFNDDLGELFAVQSNIVRGITTQIGREVVWQGPPNSNREKVSALHYYQLGNRSFFKKTREARKAARDLYLKAIEADPNAPFGYVGMSLIFWSDSFDRWVHPDMSREEILRKGAEYAEKALSTDPSYYAAHVARGDIHFIAGEHEDAIIRYRHAAELNPSSSDAVAGPTLPLIFLGRSEEAVQAMEQAIDINPVVPGWYYLNLGFAKWGVGDCAEGIKLLKKRARMGPSDLRTLMVLQACNGDLADARETVARHLEMEPNVTIAVYLERNRDTWNNPELLDRYITDMRLAGMPE